MNSTMITQNPLRKQPKKGFLFQNQPTDEDVTTDIRSSTSKVRSKKDFWSLKRRDLLLEHPS